MNPNDSAHHYLKWKSFLDDTCFFQIETQLTHPGSLVSGVQHSDWTSVTPALFLSAALFSTFYHVLFTKYRCLSFPQHSYIYSNSKIRIWFSYHYSKQSTYDPRQSSCNREEQTPRKPSRRSHRKNSEGPELLMEATLPPTGQMRSQAPGPCRSAQPLILGLSRPQQFLVFSHPLPTTVLGSLVSVCVRTGKVTAPLAPGAGHPRRSAPSPGRATSPVWVWVGEGRYQIAENTLWATAFLSF